MEEGPIAHWIVAAKGLLSLQIARPYAAPLLAGGCRMERPSHCDPGSPEVYTANERAAYFYAALGLCEGAGRNADDSGNPFPQAALHLKG